MLTGIAYAYLAIAAGVACVQAIMFRRLRPEIGPIDFICFVLVGLLWPVSLAVEYGIRPVKDPPQTW